MKRFHISISTDNFAASMQDYTKRLGASPCVVAEGRYALWRTEALNFSISCKQGQKGGMVRHIGFEDENEPAFREEVDMNGIIWEYFSREGQQQEIDDKFPQAVQHHGL